MPDPTRCTYQPVSEADVERDTRRSLEFLEQWSLLDTALQSQALLRFGAARKLLPVVGKRWAVDTLLPAAPTAKRREISLPSVKNLQISSFFRSDPEAE